MIDTANANLRAIAILIMYFCCWVYMVEMKRS